MVLTDTDLMLYGMHRGKTLANVPNHYLMYLHGEFVSKGISGANIEFNMALKAYIEDNFDSIKITNYNRR